MTEEQTNIDTGATEAPVPVPVPEAVAETRPRPGAVPGVVWGTGRRKSSVARVRVKPGTGTTPATPPHPPAHWLPHSH